MLMMPSTGKIQIEAKEDIKKRLGSPVNGLPQEKLVVLRQCIERIFIDKPAGIIQLRIRLVPAGNLQATKEVKISV